MKTEVDDRFYELDYKKFKYKISLDQIIFFSSRWPFVELCAVYESIRFRGGLNKVEQQLEKISKDFIRINKTCLINKRHILKHTNTEVIMSNNQCMPISDCYAEKLFQALGE